MSQTRPYALINPALEGIDPFDPNLTKDQMDAIYQEAKVNPHYFFDEILQPINGSPVSQDNVEEEPPPVEITEFHLHEVLHTASIIENMFDTHIVEHVAVSQSSVLKEAAEKASQALHDFYQLVGTLRFPE